MVLRVVAGLTLAVETDGDLPDDQDSGAGVPDVASGGHAADLAFLPRRPPDLTGPGLGLALSTVAIGLVPEPFLRLATGAAAAPLDPAAHRAVVPGERP